MQDIEEFNGDIELLLKNRDEVKQRFQVVQPVKAHQARLHKNGKNKKKDYEDATMNEIYDFTTISCDHRPEIKKLVATTEDLQAKMLEFADKFNQLKTKCG